MGETTFINTSKTDISDNLQSRLNEGALILRNQLDRDGVAPENWGKLVGVFLLAPTEANSDYLLIKKEGLRAFVKDLRESARRKLPIYESTILKCMEDVPAGVIRVLYISDESCGSMKLFYDEESGKEVMQARLQARLSDAMKDAEAYMSEKELNVVKSIHETIKYLPTQSALRVVQDAELATSNELMELRAKRAALGEATEDFINEFIEHLPDFRERWKSVLERVKKVVLPPDVSSANNVEVALMAATYVFDRVTDNIGLSTDVLAFLIGKFAQNEPPLIKLLARMDACLRGKPFSGELQDFGNDWMHAGFPKLEVGHKLAATLALTDVPEDIEVLAPWKAWSLIIPPGLFNDDTKGKHFARLWCVGSEVRFIVNSLGEIMGPVTREQMLRSPSEHPLALAACEAFDSLVRGACLALSNPDDYKRQTIKEKSAGAKKPQRDGEPDFSVSRFMLSAPVQIDLRDHLHATLAGKKHHGGGSPTVQFFVRGHWRQQAHGAGRALRKTIRIEGFWKGPEEGRILMRNYKVKEDERDTNVPT